MKSSLVFVIVFLISATAFASSDIITKSGQCILQQAGPFDESKLFPLTLENPDISLVFKLRGDEFFGRFIIQTTPKISNLSGTPKHIAYNISFFDHSGSLIACTSSNTDIDSNEKDLFAGSSMPEIPRSMLEKISSYQAVVYVSDKQ